MIKDVLQKMHTEFKDPVIYRLDINGVIHNMNDYLGKKIEIEWKGIVICKCGKTMSKFYRSCFCYKCYWESPLASQSIFKPELCTAHLGIEERDLEWERKFQLAEHYVYLANSSGIKVGVTRASQGITRWMDQGASQAILLASLPNRRFSGDIEVKLKGFVNDTTNWRKMLSGEPSMIDLIKVKKELSVHIPDNLKKYFLHEGESTHIAYPVLRYPKKISSVKLNNTSKIEGELLGIKGQYLLLDNDRVFNVRAHEGFVCHFNVDNIEKQGLLF